jgi:hypothetical protein
MNELDKNGFSKNTVTIFKKLCSYVNANYDGMINIFGPMIKKKNLKNG